MSNLEVRSQEDYELASNLVSTIKAKAKEARAKQDGIVNPILGSVQRIKDLFKPFLATAAQIELDTKEKMKTYLDKLDQKKERLAEKVESGKLSVASMVKQSEGLKVSGQRKIKKLLIENADLIPRVYLMPDEQAIKTALLVGKKVAGCKIIEENSVAI